MARRRDYYYHRLRRFFPKVLVLSGVLLLLAFSLLSFLAPHPADLDHLRASLHCSRIDHRDDVDVAPAVPAFRVPLSCRATPSSRNYAVGLSSLAITNSNRYLMIATRGGLNQQKTGITDAVVAARIVNATLVVPKPDQKSFWRDSGKFSEIFNVDWFITSLKKDVKIINQLPKRSGKSYSLRSMRVLRKCTKRCYHNRVLPVQLKRHDSDAKAKKGRLSRKLGKGKDVPRKDEESIADDQNGGDELEMSDPDNDGDGDGPMLEGRFNKTLVKSDDLSNNEELELEDMLSD